MRPRDIPNLLTALRILMIPPTMFALVRGHYLSALVIMAVAGATDGLDGYLARRFQWRSRIGAILDPLADKLMMMASYLTLGFLEHIPVWLSLLVVCRDLVIMSGAATYYRLFGDIDIEPTLLSKLNTVLQVAFVLIVVGGLAGLEVPDGVVAVAVILVGATTALSGLHYVWSWSRRAYRAGMGGL